MGRKGVFITRTCLHDAHLKKTCLLGFTIRSGTNQALRLRLGILDNCTIHVAKKALISSAVTAQLICAFVFAYAKSRFSHDVFHIINLSDETLKRGPIINFQDKLLTRTDCDEAGDYVVPNVLKTHFGLHNTVMTLSS